MGAFYGSSEIVELQEDSSKSFVEDDINRLFESIRISAKTKGLPQILKDHQKKSMKRPMKVNPYQASGIGISEPISLKQALRGLSISQASEMAAMKRLSKPPEIPHVKRSQIAAGEDVNDNPVKKMVNAVTTPVVGSRTSVTEMGLSRNLKLKLSSLSTRSRKKLPVVEESNETVTQEKDNKRSSVSSSMDSSATKPPLTTLVKKADEKSRSRSREKAEFSQSSKSSIGECSSSTTSFSCESNLSGVSRNCFRPHMSKDLRWEAVYSAQRQHGSLNLRNFKLIKKIGGGDIGTVYLAELIGSNCFFALKILDNELLAFRKKAIRAQTEKEILQLLDHPFLPTLFSQFTTDKYSCLVIEYCPGGDLHVLRQKQPNKCFSEQATRFYVAEILLALEYLHMLGIVYRDLKPENILVREDGHIMLTDFDLSLRCDPNSMVVKPSSPSVDRTKETKSNCVDPFCLQPSCFTPRISLKLKSDVVGPISPFPQLVVEPTSARSNSFVGTHEYLAPEIVKGEGHGSGVDWWTFGVLLYELLYGRTPFKGTGDDDTLANVVSQSLKFPETQIVSSHAKDLVKSLLRKQPENRLGSLKGAAEIKEHPFFEGLNWALIRCATPPEIPKGSDLGSKGRGENLVIDMF